MDEKFIAELKAKAAELTSYERNLEFSPSDDDAIYDAYDYGYDDGKIHLARAVLRALGLL